MIQVKTDIKQPIRMCCVCRKRKEKKTLIKFVVKDNNIIIDKYYNNPGRGVYICKDISCLKKAPKLKSLNKYLKIDINDEIYEQLIKDVFDDK